MTYTCICLPSVVVTRRSSTLPSLMPASSCWLMVVSGVSLPVFKSSRTISAKADRVVRLATAWSLPGQLEGVVVLRAAGDLADFAALARQRKQLLGARHHGHEVDGFAIGAPAHVGGAQLRALVMS